jgi:hypothetical protein
MCRRIDCATCGRPTFTGCGAHIEQVLRDVPRADRCHCREDEARGVERKVEPSNSEGDTRSWFQKLLGSKT